MDYIPRVGYHGGSEGEQMQRGDWHRVTCAKDQTQVVGKITGLTSSLGSQLPRAACSNYP